MGFRFRKRSSLLGGLLHLNWSKQGLSSVSIGAPGASINVPIARAGGTRRTVGIPGTGLSWTEEGSGARKRSVRERQQQQRPDPESSTEATIQELMGALVGFNKPGDAFWRQGLIQKVLEADETPRKVREAALLLRSPEAVELHLRRAKGPAATRRAALEVCAAVSTVVEWTDEQGWSQS